MSALRIDVTARPVAGNGAVADRTADQEAAREVRAHHAAMVAELDRLSARLRDAGPGEQEQARQALAGWLAAVLVPHADEEEATTYRAAAQLIEGRLLIAGMVAEHVLIKRLVALLGESEPVPAAAYGRAVFAAFESHQRKENDLILPLLVDSPDVSLAAVAGAAQGHHQVGEAHAHPHQ